MVGDQWLDDYSRRFTETLGDSVEAGRAAADRWAQRARADQHWTADSMTADAIAEWDEFVPLLGRWLDLGLEAAQRAVAGVVPDTGAPLSPPRMAQQDPESPTAQRVAGYQELISRSAEKFRTSTYRSEDLVEDWLTLSAKAAQDVVTGAALFWGRLANRPPD